MSSAAETSPHDADPHDADRHDAEVVVATPRFGEDLELLLGELGFRIESIWPADAPSTAVVSGHGVRLRLIASPDSAPVTLRLPDGGPETGTTVTLAGGSSIERRPTRPPVEIPPNQPSLTISHAKRDHDDDRHDDRDTNAEPGDGHEHAGRAGMRYRDLIPDRWGGRFIASVISIPEGGPVPDYVHFHRIRFQLIAVKRGWVRVVYEGQGEPFVLHAGDCVIQPPTIRHRVLEASPGLQVVEVTTPAVHETIADWATDLPDEPGDPDREWYGQRFVRHIARDAELQPWRAAGWMCRESGVADATSGLAGVRFALPAADAADAGETMVADGEFTLLVVLTGDVSFVADGRPPVLLTDGSSVAIPNGVTYRLDAPSPDCELLDLTLPA